MIYVNSLLALRFANVFLFAWLLLEVCRRLADDRAWRAFWGVAPVESEKNTTFKWSDVDIRKPPSLNDSKLEALRLNEFFARPHYSCRDRRNIGSKSDSFFLCYEKRFLVDEDTFGKTLVVTGLTNSAAVFEGALNVTRWAAFMPPDAPILDEFKTDVELSYIPEVNEEQYFPVETIIDGVKDSKFTVAKLEFYSNHMNDDQLSIAPKHVERLLPWLRTDHLLLQIRIESESAVEVAPMWLRLLYQLYFEHGFALIGSQSNGACNRPLGHCTYRVSFVHVSMLERTEPPVWGLGSPGEERLRLMRFLQAPTENCSIVLEHQDGLPPMCMDYEELDVCSILYFRYRELSKETFASFAGQFGRCSLTLYYPEQGEFPTAPGQFLVSLGILPKSQTEQLVHGLRSDSRWQLEPFSSSLSAFSAKASSKRYLLLDLDGDEPEVVDSLFVNCDDLKHFRQISFRLRVFFGEENRSYRRLYLGFLQLESCGFSLFISKRVDTSTSLIAFKRDSGFV